MSANRKAEAARDLTNICVAHTHYVSIRHEELSHVLLVVVILIRELLHKLFRCPRKLENEMAKFVLVSSMSHGAHKLVHTIKAWHE